jgi:tetratricopeptide (TPR) repeat protein
VPGNQWGYRALGTIYFEMGRREEAREMLERGNELQPTAWGYANLATLDFEAGRYEDAARLYELAVSMDDSEYRLWGNLASAYLWLPGRREAAVKAYREAVTLAEEELKVYPQNWELMCLLGGYYAEIGEREKALELTERSLTYEQDDVEMMFQAGHNYEVLGDRDTALEWIEKALVRGYSREMIERTPALRGLIADQRYKELVQRLGLEA